MPESTRAILVAGAQGVIGRAAAEHFSSLPKTKVYALSRRKIEGPQAVTPVSVDLLSRESVQRALAPLTDVTHVIFGAYIEKNTPGERSAVNVALLRNLLDVLEKTAP